MTNILESVLCPFCGRNDELEVAVDLNDSEYVFLVCYACNVTMEVPDDLR